MTRINASIPPANLTDQHLMAEIKEINQLAGSFRKSTEKKNIHEIVKMLDELPKTFRLGTGHVKFFYDKPRYLMKRFEMCKQEAIKRGFEVNAIFQDEWSRYMPNALTDDRYDYVPTKEARELLLERITLRLTEQKPVARYYRKEVSKQEAIELLNKQAA